MIFLFFLLLCLIIAPILYFLSNEQQKPIMLAWMWLALGFFLFGYGTIKSYWISIVEDGEPNMTEFFLVLLFIFPGFFMVFISSQFIPLHHYPLNPFLAILIFGFWGFLPLILSLVRMLFFDPEGYTGIGQKQMTLFEALYMIAILLYVVIIALNIYSLGHKE